MRDKIVFFVLGAVLATIAYLIGDLETLTAEDKITELDFLRVNRLVVKDGMVVGDIGKKFILISADKEVARITLYGGEAFKTFDGFRANVNETPTLSFMTRSNAALIKAESHSKRPEATTLLGVVNLEGKTYKSLLMIEDLEGLKSIYTD